MKSELVFYIIIVINIGTETTHACFKNTCERKGEPR